MGLRTRSVVDALHEELRARVLGGSFVPGSALTEVSIATEFEVARPTAKAAIERLIAEGLLVRPNRRSGAVVPSFDQADIRDLYATRILLETAAHGLLVEHSHAVPAARAEHDKFLVAARQRDFVEVVRSDVTFHRALVGATGSSRLIRLHELLMSEAHLCMSQVQARQLLSPEAIASEHLAILEGVEAGDGAAVAVATENHLRNAEGKLVEALFR